MNHPTALAPDDLLQALRWRYATKAFDPTRKIPAATWAALEESLVLSPSSFGLQPYRFLVIEDPTMRRELLPHTWGQKQVVDASHFVVLAGRTQVTEAEIDTFLHLTATTRGMEVAKLAGYRGMMTGSLLSEGFQPKVPHWAECQTYLALGTLLSAAALLRVDACPIEGFLPAEYDRLLGLTAQGLTATVCCALGYRAGSDKHATAPKVRHPKSSLVQRV